MALKGFKRLWMVSKVLGRWQGSVSSGLAFAVLVVLFRFLSMHGCYLRTAVVHALNWTHIL